MVKRHIFAAAVALIASAPAGLALPPEREVGPTIDDLANLVEIGNVRGGVTLSPDGAYLASFERTTDIAANNYRFRVIVISTITGEARIVGDGGGFIPHAADGRRSGAPIEREPLWSADSKSLFYIAEREGRAELWRSDLASGAAARVVEFEGDVRQIEHAADGAILVETDPPRASLAHTLREALATGFLVDERASPVYALRPMQNAAASYFVVGDNGATRSIDAATRTQLRAAQSPIARLEPVAGSDGIVSPDLELHATIDGADIVCAAETCRGDLRGAQSLPSGDIIFLRLEGFAAAETSLYAWSPRSGRVDQLYTGDARPAGCSAQDSSHIFCLYEDLRTPRRVIVFERAGARHQMRTLYEPNPQWADFALPTIERLDFTDQRGLQSYAHLIYPLDYAPGQTYPLVIVQYRSRGFLRGGVGGEHPIYPLASRGYFVLSVERPEDRVRMASVDSRTFEREQELSGEERRMKLDAIDEFLTRVERRGLVDPDRIAITGMSDGAETLFWALLDRRYAAAVTSSPPSDPSAWWLGSARFRLASEQRIGLTPPWDTSLPWARWWRDNNIAAFAPRIQTPILFNLSDAEALTAMPLYVRLREEGHPTEMYVYADSYHLKWRPRQLRAAQSRAIAWIERWTAP